MIKRQVSTLLFVLFLLGGFGLHNASAADFAFVGIESQLHVFGVGLGVTPDYEGSNDYMFGGAPFGKYVFKGSERFVQLKGFEIQANLLDHPWLRLGPSVNYRFARDDVRDHYVDKMRDVDGTVEGGGWLGVEFVNAQNPRKRFAANVDMLVDMANEHDGYTVYLQAGGWYPVHKLFDVYLGFTGTYASSNYMDTYFSVDENNHNRSGLPEFDAAAGVKDFRVSPALIMHLSHQWHLAAGFQYRCMLGDADDSPVVDDRGSSSQFIGGLGLAYSW